MNCTKISTNVLFFFKSAFLQILFLFITWLLPNSLGAVQIQIPRQSPASSEDGSNISSVPTRLQNDLDKQLFQSIFHEPGASIQSTSHTVHFKPHADTKPITDLLAESALDHAPETVREIVHLLKNRDIIDDEAIPKKLVLIGPPGTGKSTIGKAIAHVCKMPVFKYTASAIADRYKDSGSKNLEDIFSEAAHIGKPCVIIIDEFESLIQKHENKHDTESGMLTTLWTLLDEYEDRPILFVANMNDASASPPQIKNRFREYVVYVPLPEEIQRRELLAFYRASYRKVIFSDDASVEQLARLTKEFAHRDLKNLFHVAIRKAYSKGSNTTVALDHFKQALQEMSATNKYIGENLNQKIEKKTLKWGMLALGTFGATLSLAGYINHTVGQKASLAAQQEALKMQQESLRIQKNSFWLAAGTSFIGLAMHIFAPRK